MIPPIVYDLGHIRLAEMHRQAERDALARSLRRARRADRRDGAAAQRAATLSRWAHRLGRVSVP
jgi:hypothetical protein